MKTNANLVALSVDEQVETNGGIGWGVVVALVIVGLLVSSDSKQEETVPPESNE